MFELPLVKEWLSGGVWHTFFETSLKSKENREQYTELIVACTVSPIGYVVDFDDIAPIIMKCVRDGKQEKEALATALRLYRHNQCARAFADGNHTIALKPLARQRESAQTVSDITNALKAESASVLSFWAVRRNFFTQR
jgi:hypothetical protein